MHLLTMIEWVQKIKNVAVFFQKVIVYILTENASDSFSEVRFLNAHVNTFIVSFVSQIFFDFIRYQHKFHFHVV